ncbi:MAG: insulinase family protein [Haliscomenobacter sp.]|nr:insulinase family protein [Haliscomenobacter sp.]
MKKIILTGLSCCFLLCLSIHALAQSKLVEKVERKGNELLIPYEKYVLANGLTVIVHEDHSDPVVHVDVTYHVGSAREEIGKSGFAHFFEHMMFQGSDHVADEEHFKLVTEAGGTLNGSTNRDRTNYYETLPSNQVEIGIWLEADRMGFLLDAVTQKKFEIQRATVKNERGQNYDNRPYGLAGEITSKNLYPYGHPYSWLTIGYIEDLNRVDVNDLKRFFLRWYGPNNATLTVGGDVSPAQVVKLAEKYFGSIPIGPEVQNMPKLIPVLESDRYVSYVDNYIRFPRLQITRPSVPSYHPDKAALDCLAALMAQGKNTVFYQNFIKTQKAQQASAFNSGAELSGEFSISIQPNPGQTLSDMEALALKTIGDFEAKGVSDEEVERYKAQYEASRINALASVSGKVSQLAAYQTFTGNPNQFPSELAAVRALTKADVLRVFTQYVKSKPAVILSILPKTGDVKPAGADNYQIDSTKYAAPADQYAGLTYVKAKDRFDRSTKPAGGPNPAISVPALWRTKLANGIQIIGAQNSEIPTVTLSLTIKGGQMLDPIEKAGLANLCSQMLREGTENYSAEDFENELRDLGTSINASASETALTFSMNTLVKNLGQSLKLFEERVFRSKFQQEDFTRIQQNTIRGIINSSTQAASVASGLFNTLIYGKNDIRGYALDGTEETVAKITLADVEQYYKNHLSAPSSHVVIVGDITQADMLPKLGFLNSMPSKPISLPELKPAVKTDKAKIFLVDQPKAAQSEIRIGYPALPFDATGEFFKAGLVNYNLGGAFNSRINLNLREDKGYTYGARSAFSGDFAWGTFVASAGVKATATDSSVIEFMKEITQFRNTGMTDAELAFMKSSIGQRDALRYETGFQKAGFLSQIAKYNLPADFAKKQSEIIKNSTRAELNALAKKWLKPENAFILVVGDKTLIKPGLEKLGYEVIELDKKGNEVVIRP